MSDLHLADRPPAMRTASYEDDIIAKVRWVMDRALDLDADRVIITGDVFHRKEPIRTSHRLMQRVRAELTRTRDLPGAVGQYPRPGTHAVGSLLPVSIVVGNHDHGPNFGIDGQPLANVLGGHISMLWGPDTSDPYIYGIGWHGAFAETQDEILAMLGNYFHPIVEPPPPLIFMHCGITLDPNPYGPEQRGWVTATAVADLIAAAYPLVEQRPRLVMAGHMHGGHPVTTINGITFANPGALARGSIADSDRDRTPQTAVIDYDPDSGALDVRYEPVPYRPAAILAGARKRGWVG